MTKKIECEDCGNKFNKEDITPYKYDPSIKLCDSCHDDRMIEDDDIEIEYETDDDDDEEPVCKVSKKLTVPHLLNQIEKLADAVEEKRSDIHEILINILEGEEFKESDVEHRFVRCNIGKYDVLYDTLTTMVEYTETGSEEWNDADNITYDD